MKPSDEWKTLKRYAGLVEAQLAESYLRAHNIECELRDRHILRLYGLGQVFNGMRLQVRKQDFMRAHQLLEAIESSAEDEPETKSPQMPLGELSTHSQKRMGRLAMVLVLLGIAAISLIEFLVSN